MSRPLVTENIETLKPYKAGKPIEELERELGISGSIKLASNENPLGPSPAAVEAIVSAASGVNFYPDAGTFRLRHAIADHVSIDPDEIIVGNGSNEVLTIAVRTFCEPGSNAVVSDYGFIAYRLILQAAGIETRSIPTDDRFAQDLDAMVAACDDATSMLFLANPNNPTGTHVGAEELRAFLTAVPEHVVVVLDEAYVEYARDTDYASALAMRDARENLLVCRTFSKIYGLAGLRVGFGVAPQELIDFMNRVREPFNSSLVAQAAAIAALGDREHVRRSVEQNEAGREVLEAGLRALGWDFVPSQTNFLLVRTPRPGGQIYDALLREGVIVRPVAGYGLPDWIRVSIGTTEQTERFIAAANRIA